MYSKIPLSKEEKDEEEKSRLETNSNPNGKYQI